MTSEAINVLLQKSISIPKGLHPNDEKARRSALHIASNFFANDCPFKGLLARLNCLKFVAEVADILELEMFLMALHFATSKLMKSVILEVGMNKKLFTYQEVITLEKSLNILELGYSTEEYQNYCSSEVQF